MDSKNLVIVQDFTESEFTDNSHILKVDQVLFRVSADILRLCHAVKEPTTSPLIISGLTAAQFRSFLTVATAKTIQGQFSLSIGEWGSALHAAMQLECGTVGIHAINSINPYVATFQPVPLIRLGLIYQVNSWAKHGFTRLIERDEHLSSEEGTKLGMDLVLAIYRSRETLARGQKGGEQATTVTELINREPSLNEPKFTKLDPIKFQTPADALPATEDPLHYQTSLVDLLVDDRVWRVTMATLGSTPYFLKRVNQSENPVDGEFHVIDLSGEVDKAELESYLSLVNARRFQHSSGESLRLNFQQWVSALRLATIFGHHEARRSAITYLDRRLRDQDPFDVIDAAKICKVDQWLESQYTRIAERSKFPSEEEGRRLGVTSLLAVCKLREEAAYRSGPGPGFGQLIQAASKAKSGRP
ncbi:hypothetical protein FRC00_014468 [Tulasnella sp. 408]|nr:hypothetical protein FRC00_014468 [Tulasnella sp. 408]